MKWPPAQITAFNPLDIPLLNTIILLSSGITATWSHHAVKNNQKAIAIVTLFITVILGIYFTSLQLWEYHEAGFSIYDSTYASLFFIATGFHGFHVLVGTLFLITCFVRIYLNHFSSHHHFGFEASLWYWHFVDVVWLFLYFSVYYHKIFSYSILVHFTSNKRVLEKLFQ